jgi:hypothetical protein
MKQFLILVIFSFSSFIYKGETKPNSPFFKASLRDTISKLPFGSPILVRHKFPKNWNYPGEDDAAPLSNPHLAASYKLIFFYNHINTLKPTLLLQPTTIKKIAIGDDSLITEDKEKLNPKIAYQLPDFGPYKCYYQNDYRNHKGLKSKDFKNYLEIGNLILYNQKGRLANILKIYTSYSHNDSFDECHRFFYISKDKSIFIYTCCLGETEGYMKKTQIITVNSAGKIIITNLK